MHLSVQSYLKIEIEVDKIFSKKTGNEKKIH